MISGLRPVEPTNAQRTQSARFASGSSGTEALSVTEAILVAPD